MTRFEEIKQACETLEHSKFHGKGFESESTILNNAPWLVKMVERLRNALNEGFNELLSREHQDKWIVETHALLAELEEGK